MTIALKHILLVEDDAAIAEPLSYALKRESWSVHWAGSGQEALDYLAKNTADFIILDVGLPDMNGFELCKKIKKDSDIPLIFLTARSEEVDRIVGLEIGADDYCSKPFSLRELIARIKVIHNRYTTPPPNSNAATTAPPHNQNWYYNADRQELYYRQQLLQLTPIEQKLLLVFIKNPHRILTRDHLMEQAWEHPQYSLARTVDAHIKSIRHKLKAVTDAEVIKTHRGFGYELVE